MTGHTRRRSESGSALVELAVTLPVLVTVLMATPWQCTASGQHRLYFSVVTASKSFRLVSTFVPGVPNPLPMSRTAWQRIQ